VLVDLAKLGYPGVVVVIELDREHARRERQEREEGNHDLPRRPEIGVSDARDCIEQVVGATMSTALNSCPA
jgi:hypothetical protein